MGPEAQVAQSTRTNDPSNLFSLELMQTDDVSKIAAQIANQAELIYQAWKTTDLNPNELIHYHSVTPDRNSPFRQVQPPQGSPISPNARLNVRDISPAPPGSSPAIPRRVIEIPISTDQLSGHPFQSFPQLSHFQHPASPSRSLNNSPRPYVPSPSSSIGGSSIGESSPQSSNRSFHSNSPTHPRAFSQASSGYSSLPRTSPAPPAPPERSSSYTGEPTSNSPPQKLESSPDVESSLRDLVTSFVLEDKARNSRSKVAPSTIQDALQKFEKQMAITSRAGSPAEVVVSRCGTSVAPSVRQSSPSYNNYSPKFSPRNEDPESRRDQDNRIRRSTSPGALAQPGWNEASQGNTSTWPLKNKSEARRNTPSPTQTNFITTLDTRVDHSGRSPSVAIRHKVVTVSEPNKAEERLIQALRQGTMVEDGDRLRPYHEPSYTKISNQKPSGNRITPIGGRSKYNDTDDRAGDVSPPTFWTGSPTPDHVGQLSNVDYAKVRYQDAQQHPRTSQRMEDYRNYASKPTVNGDGRVMEAKTRYEVNTPPSEIPWRTVPSDSGPEFYRRKVRKPRKTSPEPIQGSAASLPHPELTDQQKAHIRERSQSPAVMSGANVVVRPFLTQGSVAERVLLFEKAPGEVKKAANSAMLPEKRRPAFSTWRDPDEVRTKAQDLGPSPPLKLNESITTISSNKQAPVKDISNNVPNRDSSRPTIPSGPMVPPVPIPQKSTARRLAKNSKNLHIPRFYYPMGRPVSQATQDQQLQAIAECFRENNGQIHRDNLEPLIRACNVPLYWKMPLFTAAGGEKFGYLTQDIFLDYWARIIKTCHDASSRFVKILSRGSRNYLVPDDFLSLIQDVVDTHPGVTFLKEATEFHSRYVHTVIARIYYCVNRSWSGRITVPEIRRSNLLQVISYLEEEEDINKITDYFSYEHFYVIYCKFWELDTDHDLYIDRNDLTKHNERALSWRIIERIFSGAVTKCRPSKQDRMGYQEFVWFLMAEEDKRHPTAIEYWFRCMDLDGDGYLSMYELEYFYEEQLQKMEALGIETLPFSDCLCQMLDMVRPEVDGKISLRDLKKCRMTPVFFDTFFNLEKYLDHEQRDPFSCHRIDEEGAEMTDWDKYAADEYEILVAEEGAGDQQDDMMYTEEDELSIGVDELLDGDHMSDDHMFTNVGSLSKHSPLSATVTNLAMDMMDVEDDYKDY